MAPSKPELKDVLRQALLRRLANRDIPPEQVDEERLGEIAVELDATLDQMVARQEEIRHAELEMPPKNSMTACESLAS